MSYYLQTGALQIQSFFFKIVERKLIYFFFMLTKSPRHSYESKGDRNNITKVTVSGPRKMSPLTSNAPERLQN